MESEWIPLVYRFFIIFARIGGLFVSAPFFASQGFIFRPRIIFSVLFTLLLYPVLPLSLPGESAGVPGLVAVLAGEVAAGLVMGLVINVLFAGVQLAGQVMGFEVGYTLVQTIDPMTMAESMVVSIFWNLIAMALFLALNGHHLLIQTLAESYRLLPPGTFHLPEALITRLIQVTGAMFVIGIQLAAPVLVIIIVLDVLIGLISRAAPNIQILLIGFPVKILAGFTGIGLGLFFFPRYLEQTLHTLVQELQKILALAG